MFICGQTDIGKVRDTNQDVFVYNQLQDDLAYILVCDGMGGANGGNVASQMTRDIISNEMLSRLDSQVAPDQIQLLMAEAFHKANQAVFAKGEATDYLNGMGTTAVLAVIVGQDLYIGHVGDSRAYLWHQQALTRLTRDHSLVQVLLEQGKITTEEAQTHPQRNRITRAIGATESIELDFNRFSFQKADRLLLCSDGLTNSLSEQEIASYLSACPIGSLCTVLVREANQSGGHDNITVVVAEQ